MYINSFDAMRCDAAALFFHIVSLFCKSQILAEKLRKFSQAIFRLHFSEGRALPLQQLLLFLLFPLPMPMRSQVLLLVYLSADGMLLAFPSFPHDSYLLSFLSVCHSRFSCYTLRFSFRFSSPQSLSLSLSPPRSLLMRLPRVSVSPKVH